MSSPFPFPFSFFSPLFTCYLGGAYCGILILLDFIPPIYRDFWPCKLVLKIPSVNFPLCFLTYQCSFTCFHLYHQLDLCKPWAMCHSLYKKQPTCHCLPLPLISFVGRVFPITSLFCTSAGSSIVSCHSFSLLVCMLGLPGVDLLFPGFQL